MKQSAEGFLASGEAGGSTESSYLPIAKWTHEHEHDVLSNSHSGTLTCPPLLIRSVSLYTVVLELYLWTSLRWTAA